MRIDTQNFSPILSLFGGLLIGIVATIFYLLTGKVVKYFFNKSWVYPGFFRKIQIINKSGVTKPNFFMDWKDYLWKMFFTVFFIFGVKTF
jgi:hypothetical protein